MNRDSLSLGDVPPHPKEGGVAGSSAHLRTEVSLPRKGIEETVMVVGKIVLNVASAKSSAREADVKHAAERPKGHPLSELGWTKEQTAEARRRVAGLEYLWDDPSMDAYDDL